MIPFTNGMENDWKKYINYIEKKMDKIEWVI